MKRGYVVCQLADENYRGILKKSDPGLILNRALQ